MVTITLEEQDVRNVLAGLGELPFKMSYRTISIIEMQLAESKKNDNLSQEK